MYRGNLRHAGLDRRGAMLALVAICLPVILAFGIFSINLAWMQLTRTELRVATDAAVKAGSRTLSISQDTDVARQWAITAAARNHVGGTPLRLAETDVVFGLAQVTSAGGYSFTPQPDSSFELTALKVTGRRDAGSLNGPVPMLFNGLFDRTNFEPVKVAVATQIDRDIALVLDRSGSMNNRSLGVSRWMALRVAVAGFLYQLNETPQSEIVSASSYSTDATLDIDLTLDYDAVEAAVARQPVRGGTGIGMGMRRGIASLTDTIRARPLAFKSIVVMTDGIHNHGVDPVVVAAEASALGITVHTVTLGHGANQSHMKRVADAGDGGHWHAADEKTLVGVFMEIAKNLPTLITE